METKNTHKVQRTDNKTPEVLQPLANPVASLTHCLKLLSSEKWESKMEGMRSVQALTQNHPEELLEKLNDVCLAVIAEVSNLRSSVACAAMDTIICLAINMQRAMDTHVERAGHALLLKIAQSSANFFVQKKVNTALEALVKNCSPVQVLNVLVYKGLSHLSAAVRSSTAQKLHLLVDTLGAEAILSTGKSFTESFISAVRKMSLDAAADVRPHGHAILQQLAPYSDFMKLWMETIEEKDRLPLRKILRNATQAVDLEKELRLEALNKF
ncbi:hypothetical protein Q5P01_003341 [Channa striata]|uniref:TOG domain-containing protein n=1 Tax=Channa striata TaxID=64152 RepID=A0AA88T4P6_CHASR|nr:hypothetical protein Q5P01_003341 [Channa striata]